MLSFQLDVDFAAAREALLNEDEAALLSDDDDYFEMERRHEVLIF